ncbi:MAG TPA: hypothetical protein VKD72_07730 [Gemmataceae bacterium]|nr:hypothetical protein [Gemmataceae bacterium]
MTEAEWLACKDLQPMREFLRGKVSERKLRLLLCACCRSLWDQLIQEWSRTAVEVVEWHIDGGATDTLLWAATRGAREAWERVVDEQPSCAGYAAAAYAATLPIERGGDAPPLPADQDSHMAWDRMPVQNRVIGAALLREIVGNPFRPVFLDSTWPGSPVVALARAAYTERGLPSGHLEPDRLAVLSDALEEAGCDNADLLAHLRGPGPHVRGCWVVDLLLGKQ